MPTNGIREDIYKKQQEIIQSQRTQLSDLQEENNSLETQINRLTEVEQELLELRSALAANGNLSYYQAMAPILQRRNQVIEAEKKRLDFEKQQAWELEQSAIRGALEQEIRKEYPDLIKYHENRKLKIQQTRDKMLDLAERFYNMSDIEAELYFSDNHNPSKSAIMDLVIEIEENGYLSYRCGYCEKDVNTLGELERHCYNEGEDHRDINLRRIQDNTISEIGKVFAELQAAIDNAIQSKRNAEYKAEIEKQQADQAKVKKGLPFVH